MITSVVASVTGSVTSTAGMAWLLSCALKASLLLAASALGATLLRRGTAAARHQIWTLGAVGALVMPLLCWALPSLPLTLPSLALSSQAPVTAATGSFEAAAVVVTGGATTAAAPTWPMWLALAWTLGTLVVGFRVIRGHLAARRLARAADPRIAAAWSAALHDAATTLGVTTHIRLLRSDAIGSPMTVGVRRPRVLLPIAADAWSPARLRAVLLHELGHVRRHDTLIQLAAQVGCALAWWNPLTWLAAARLRIEREHACDDLVITAGVLPSSYAADLLAVARSIATAPHPHAGATGMVDRSGTAARLRRIVDATAPRRPLPVRARAALTGLALAATVTLACTSSEPTRTPTPAPAPAPKATATAAPVAPTVGTLSVGTPFVADFYTAPPGFQGALDLAAVSAEVQRHVGDLEQCYRRRLAVDPALAGKVVIHWTITETGEVPDQCITEDTVHDKAISDCVNKLVRAGRYPPPRGGAVDVSFPFVFTAPTIATR